jgi:hypothetical protein
VDREDRPDRDARWCVGLVVGRTIYKDGMLAGMFDTREDAVEIVEAANRAEALLDVVRRIAEQLGKHGNAQALAIARGAIAQFGGGR